MGGLYRVLPELIGDNVNRHACEAGWRLHRLGKEGTSMVSPAGNVSVTASNVPGITLIPFPSPEVSSFLAPLPSIPLSLQTVLPYSILIRNATSKPIFAYT